jgi:rubrerythrin
MLAADVRPDRRGWGRQAYRCPDCGTLEHTDSVIPGCCPVCPGLVGLVAV